MLNNKFIASFKSVMSHFDETDLVKTFQDAEIDSIDLVTIRVELEKIIGNVIPDSIWLNFETISEVISYCSAVEEAKNHQLTKHHDSGLNYKLIINMPQMALAALSENWLFKEIGSLHWDLLCSGLNTSSFDLKDELGNRLYATFVRISLDFSGNLNSFKESEELSIVGAINRFGDSMYFSNIKLKSNNEIISANLMTTFSIRSASDNTKLTKSQPFEVTNMVESLSKLPQFGNDYRLLKKGELKTIRLKDFEYEIRQEIIFERAYELNPYYDLNGVNLLYFAAYPIINDKCEAEFFNKNIMIEERWEQTYYTSYRDIFYFSNCNIFDTLIYRLRYYKELDNGSIVIQSELVRKSDMHLIAVIFTVKSKL